MTSGSKVLFLVDAPFEEEEIFKSLVKLTGIKSYTIEPCFTKRPYLDDAMNNFASKKDESICTDLPSLASKYLKEQFRHEVHSLHDRIVSHHPTCIVAMGVVPLWFTQKLDKIGTYRGVIYNYDGIPLIATYAVETIRKDYSTKQTVCSDIYKILNPPRQLERVIHVCETVEDVERAITTCKKSSLVAVDTETEARQITCLSLAPSAEVSFSIPIWSSDKGNVFTFEEELSVWKLLSNLLLDQSVAKVFHNAAYDLNYFRDAGILVRGRIEDTMILAHSLNPEGQKSLGYLASIYCNEPEWKTLRTIPQYQDGKKDG